MYHYEHRSLQTSAGQPGVDEVTSLVREASCSSLNTSLEGELVHLTCPVSYNGQVLGDGDPLLQSTPANQRTGLKLEAYMDVFQWEEHVYTKIVGNRRERDHLYFREWYSTTPPSNATFFGNGRKCVVLNGGRDCFQWNPAVVESWWNASGYKLGWDVVDTAQNITFGNAYVLSISMDVMDQLTYQTENPLHVTPSCIVNGDSDQEGPCKSATLQQTELGDNTIVWQQVDSNGESIDYLTRFYNLYAVDTVSVLAVQQGNSFIPWETADGEKIFEFKPGSYTASQMIAAVTSSAQKGRLGAIIPFVGFLLVMLM